MPKINPTALYMRTSISTALNKILDTPLTIVEAPMGYGKTTAIREFAARSGAKVLWKTLQNQSVDSFWQVFTRLIAKVDPVCAEQLSNPGFPDSDFFMEEAVSLLETVDFPCNTLIVIDDYHLLDSPEVDRFIESLIKREIPHLHVVIISRVVFGDNTAELILKGYCTLIDKKQFELTQPEIIEYFKACGVRLSQQEATELSTYTEGWISALYLCLLSFLQEGRFTKQNSLQELLEKAVYQPCTTEVKDFLLTLCIFDTFSLEQAQALRPQENARSILKKLLAENAFITYDSLNRTYQLHNILTLFLREIFARKTLAERQAIWRAAAEWHITNKEYIEAMEYLHLAADSDRLMTVLEWNKGIALNSVHLDQLKLYFQDCPPAIIAAHPRASLIFAFELFANNEYELFAAQCGQIRENLEHNSRFDPMEREQLTGELELLCSFSKYNRIQDMSVHNRLACRLLKQPAAFYDRKGSWSFESPSVLYMFHRETGRLEQEVHDLAECMPYYYQISDNHGFGAESVMQAERHYLCGEFDAAEIAAHTALYAAKSRDQLSPLLAALFVHLRIALLRGNATAVTGILEQMREVTRTAGLSAYLRTTDLCEGFLYATLNENKKIPDWILAGNAQASRLPFPAHGFYNILYGKVLLLQGNYAKLLGLAGHFQAIAAIFPNPLGQLYTHIVESAACERMGRSVAAAEAFRQALALAVPDQLVMPFVENATFIMPLLEKMSPADPDAPFIRKVLQLHAKYGASITSLRHCLSADDRLDDLLTAREQEIAELLASGLSNQRIAATLFITEATVKKALQNIYTKLHINNRIALTKIVLNQKQNQH